MCVNNLPEVVTWKCNGRESNHDPLGRESNVSGTADENLQESLPWIFDDVDAIPVIQSAVSKHGRKQKAPIDAT